MATTLLRSIAPSADWLLAITKLPRHLLASTSDSDWPKEFEREAADEYERELGHNMPVAERRELAERRANCAPRVRLAG